MKWVVLTLAMLVASCQADLRVDVRQEADGRLRIEATDPSGHHPCLDVVAISRVVSKRDEPVWSVALDPPYTVCTSVIRYPMVPPGYSASAPGAPLRSGDHFAVSVTSSSTGGHGRSAEMRFGE